MIEEKYKLEIFEIYNKYLDLRKELDDLEKLTQFLKNRQELNHRELSDTRNRENSLINKIEQETGKRLTSDDLLEIIKGYEE
jgi:uncharacterized coiled-coil DUF342 family protein